MKLTETIQTAKDFLRANFHEGVNCPCCDQNVKLYRRKLTSAMAFALLQIYKRDNIQAGFFHVEDHLKKIPNLPSSIRGDFAKLKYWGLIKKLDFDREDGSNRNGHYRITVKGRDFIQGKVLVESHVFLYNNKIQGKSDAFVSFKDSLGNKFNFNELMQGI